MIKAHIGSLLYNSMGRQQPLQSPIRSVHQQATSSLSEVETESKSDTVDRVVGSSPSTSSDESSPETDFLRTRTRRGNITDVKIWTKAGTGRERQLC